MGRFLQPDPLVPEPFDPQSLNRYSYVMNDPVNRIDPTGLLSTSNESTHSGGWGSGGSSFGDPFGSTFLFVWTPSQASPGFSTSSRQNPPQAQLPSGIGTPQPVQPAREASQGTQFAGPGAPRSLEEIRALDDWGLNTLDPIDPEMVELYEQLLIVIPAEAAAGAAAKAAGATRTGAAAAARSAVSLWKLGANKSASQWASQMARRGWTPEQISEAIRNGQQFKAVNNVNPGNAATRFVHPATGRSVVQDTVTKEIIHVGGTGFRY